MTIRTEDCGAGQAFHRARTRVRASFLREDSRDMDDGTYDVFIVDAEELPDVDDAIRLELTVTRGERKGDVVAVIAKGLAVDAVTALGLPATLVVTNGEPSVSLA